MKSTYNYKKNTGKEFTTVIGKDPNKIIRKYQNTIEYDKYRLLWEKASNLEIIPDYPIQIDFELNYSCNFTCAMCSWSAENKSNKGKNTWLDFNIFKSVVSEGVKKGLKAVRLNHINEPLIRKDIIKFIEFAKQAGVLDIYLSTNGALLTKDISEKLINSGLTRLQISLDAHTSKTFNVIRQGGDFEKIKKNVIDFVELKKKIIQSYL